MRTHPGTAARQALTFTPGPRAAFRASLAESLLALVANGAPIAAPGLRRAFHGARRIYELVLDLNPNPALAASTTRDGWYQWM